VASIPIPGGRSLRPVKNKREVFAKSVDQNSHPIFHYAINTLNKEPKEGEGLEPKKWGNLRPISTPDLGEYKSLNILNLYLTDQTVMFFKMSIIFLPAVVYSKKKSELALSSPAAHAQFVSQDYTAFTAHADQHSLRQIATCGLDATLCNNNVAVGQSVSLLACHILGN